MQCPLLLLHHQWLLESQKKDSWLNHHGPSQRFHILVGFKKVEALGSDVVPSAPRTKTPPTKNTRFFLGRGFFVWRYFWVWRCVKSGKGGAAETTLGVSWFLLFQPILRSYHRKIWILKAPRKLEVSDSTNADNLGLGSGRTLVAGGSFLYSPVCHLVYLGFMCPFGVVWLKAITWYKARCEKNLYIVRKSCFILKKHLTSKFKFYDPPFVKQELQGLWIIIWSHHIPDAQCMAYLPTKTG